MRHVWIIAPDQERVELVTESGDEDAELRPTIDLIVTYADPAEFEPPAHDKALPADGQADAEAPANDDSPHQPT